MCKTKDERILAFDQSSNSTGYSVLQICDENLISYGILKLSDVTKKSSGNTYYDEKVENVKVFLDKCISFFKPCLIILEDVQRQTNVKTFKDLAYLQGVLKNYCYANYIPFAILKPSEWRAELKIRGNKREIVKKNAIDFIKKEFDIEAKEDEAESICIGLAGRRLLEKGKLEIFKEI